MRELFRLLVSNIYSWYLREYTHVWAAVESTTPPGSPLRKAAPLSTPSASLGIAESIASPAKRRYVADTLDVDVVKKIKQNEVELRDRNTVLRGTKANVCTFTFSVGNCSLHEFIQNFSGIRTAYTEKLKKLRDPKANAAAPTAASSGNSTVCHHTKQALIPTSRSQSRSKEVE